MTDPLPARVELGSVKTTQGTCRSKKANQVVTVTCGLGSLASGSAATVTIVVKRLPVGTLSDTASASASSPGDQDTSNNKSTVTTTVVG